jgi:hypothetical protein
MKKGVVIYYKHLKILEEAQLTYEQIGKILSAIIRYDETGKDTKFVGSLSAFYTMIKYDVDANKAKWEEVAKARSDAGKKGGRPKKDDLGENKTGTESAQLTFNIKSEVQAIGYFIDKTRAQNFLDCGLDPVWLQGDHSFLELAAERILEKYGGKPLWEQKALFISAVRTWDELRAEYPEWKAHKETQDKAAAIKTAEKAVRENHPKICRCGGNLTLAHDRSLRCELCGARLLLDLDKNEWIYTDKDSFPEKFLTESFRDIIKRKE